MLRRPHLVTNSCCCAAVLRAAARTLPAMLAGIALCGGASADRHCSPVLFRYYDARAALHETGNACPARLAIALDFMRDASAEARACGCLDVEIELDAFIGNLPAGGADCGIAERTILELDKQLENRVAGCN
ncbi:MAG TPA: hypothetical protein VK862_12190 [Afifellaceae bacterium]|nr:hypothetical protein [Afifellaceae bacterium]